ncbi:DUF6491 family protein [Xanthomonas cassavae CFBP 4642]|uniref:DUF6491 family protein n=1 Tax=Xanthomonas cassavae CFBP 4642 TaxID=1219375 RepID=A0ABS8HCJ3_9XANT|nr:DUF6491 family protein [Xanthomonas cassavae]MCC4619823.1 DUF6491 family protein [Xanthomonas cassavae CFBP 4642]
MLVAALGTTLLASSALTASAESARPAAPDASCLDARQVSEFHQADARTLAVAERDGRLFRLQLAQNCPQLGAQADATLLAPHGWVCNGAPAYASAGQQRCAVAQVASIDARDFADLARRRNHGEVPTLEGVSVREARRRNFAGSSSYCFHPST